MSNFTPEPYPYASGGFDGSIGVESWGPPDAGDNAAVTSPSVQPTDAQQAAQFPPLVTQSSVRIAQLARMRLGDVPTAFSCRVIADGAKWLYDLPVEKIDPSAFTLVFTDGTTNNTTTPEPGTDYTMDYRQGSIIFNKTPPPGIVIVAVGSNYKDFLPGELQVYVRQAFLMHTKGYEPIPTLDVWPIPTPPAYGPGVYGSPPQPQLDEVEEYPLSLLVASMCLWDVLIGISQDVDIRTPDGVTISRAQRYSQVTQMMQLVEAKYEQLCSLLQIGLFRIQVDTLRRISRTTNRLVPIYRPQEYDDLSWRQREMVPVATVDRLITDLGQYVAGKAYPSNAIVAEKGTRYISIQPVPANGPDPVTDVNPVTNQGFYWAVSNINAANWYGTWM